MKSPNPKSLFLEKVQDRMVVIAISGKSGCGNTTVTRLLSQTLGLTMVNYTFRNLAHDEGITLQQLLELAQTDDSFDRKVDEKQVELARKGSCVLGSRLAVWVYPQADLRVYLKADTRTRVERIHQREGGDIHQLLRDTEKRDREDHQRYLDLYGIDNDSFDFVDLVLDAGRMNPNEIVQAIIEKLGEKLGLDAKP